MDKRFFNNEQKPFYRRVFFLTLIFVLLSVSLLWICLLLLYPTTLPPKAISYFILGMRFPHKALSTQTIAFLPYWKVSDAQYTRFDLLSEINYFSLSPDGNGNFITSKGGLPDPGWLYWESGAVKDIIAETQIRGGKFSLTVSSQQNKTIEAILGSKRAQERLISIIGKEVSQRYLSGIVLDFEYDGEASDTLRMTFTVFARQLARTLRRERSDTTLGITLLPLAGREKGLYDLSAITPIFDRFIGMSYDYYAQGSDIAGPIAPMFGFKEHKFFFDVSTTYEDYQRVIPKDKLIMGIPYYGYDWAVRNGRKIQSETLPKDDPNSYAAVISYARSREDGDLAPQRCQWDEYAKERWCWYADGRQIMHQVWVEDNRSIGVKYSYAKEKQFAGVAIWALGYEGNYPDLWNILERTFVNQ